MQHFPLLSVSCLLVCAVSCGNDDSSTPAGAPTYYADVQLLVARACGGCHLEGGVAPFSLDSYEALDERADIAVLAIETGRMPPWMPDPDCHSYEDERLLTDGEKEMFRDWVEAGRPLGNPEDAQPAPPPPPVFEATHSGRLEGGYVPDAERPDDYRCFVLDFDFDADMFMTASTVVPDAAALVHHVLVYAIGPDDVPLIEAADATDEGPGYTCFGGPAPTTLDEGVFLPTLIGGWVPGTLPNLLDEGRAFSIEAGSKIVMQVHYNLLSAEPERDATEFAMVLTEATPESTMTTLPIAILDLDIPAGSSRSEHRHVFRNWNPESLRIRALTGHMHLLGTELRATLVGPEGTEDACLLDIPEWDFNWQQSYGLSIENAIELVPGGGIDLTCVHDNSEENQPVVNGVQRTPRNVAWGDGTLDEMCLLYVTFEAPYDAEAGTASCGEMAAICLEECDGDGTCLLGCDAMDIECRACSLDALVRCGIPPCGDQLLGAQTCMEDCGYDTFVLGGDMTRCMEATCPAAHAALATCLSPVIDAGTCDTRLTECGISR